MKRSIEVLIPLSLQTVPDFLFKPGTDRVQKEYDGYAASLGAAIRTSGLIPALTFYTDVNRKDGEARRFQLLKAIASCLGYEVNRELDQDQQFLLRKVIADVYGESVFDRNLRGRGNDPALSPRKVAIEREWATKIVDATIALKLAMRNFKHTEDPA